MSRTLITAAALLAAPTYASKGMGGMGSSQAGEMICATFNHAAYTIEVVHEGTELFVRAPASFWSEPATTFTERHMDFSPECQSKSIYKSLFIAFNPGGHPPLDFFGGGWGAPHWDAHFFTLTVADTLPGGSNDLSSCAVTQVPVQCDVESTDPRNVAFVRSPLTEFVPPAFEINMDFGGHSIAGHGTHWIEDVDIVPGGSVYYTINGAAPNHDAPGPPAWVQCAMQQPIADDYLIDHGCRYGVWSGFSQIFITHDGAVIGHEPMFTQTLVASMASSTFGGAVTRLSRNYPQAQQLQFKGDSAQQSFLEMVSVSGEGEPVAKIGFVLGSSGMSGKKGGGRGSSSYGALSAAANSDAFLPAVAASAVGLVAVVALLGYRVRRGAAGYEPLEYAETGAAPATSPISPMLK